MVKVRVSGRTQQSPRQWTRFLDVEARRQTIPLSAPDVFDEFRVSFQFDAKELERAIEPSGGGPANHDRLSVTFALDTNLAALQQFETEIEKDVTALVKLYEQDRHRLAPTRSVESNPIEAEKPVSER